MKKYIIFVMCLFMLSLTAGCGNKQKAAPADKPEGQGIDSAGFAEEMDSIVEKEVAISQMLMPEASGELEERSDTVVVDYSNTEDGYVMVQYLKEQTKRLKVQVKGPSTTYTYNLKPQEWVAFPLSDGNGAYTVIVYENVVDKKYAVVMSVPFSVELEDEFAPFIRPNQYVDYGVAPKTVDLAYELTHKIEDPLEKVSAVYDYVVANLTYDHDKAATVKSGYLPVLDEVLEVKKGICFDYAALMTGMLRSQGVPCKLVVGYAGSVYHAWISVWSEETGWVDGVIYFDSESWKLMDPTFASSSNRSDSIMEYINDETNYTTKYLY